MYRRRRSNRRKAPIARTKEEKCVTKHCRNRRALRYTYYKSASGKTIKYEGFLAHCWKCRARWLKEHHPATYVMNALRNRARQRRLPWTITLAEFKQWCLETGYLEKRGREAGSASVDRKDHDKGYHLWNIQIRTFEENCTIGHYVPGKDCKQNEPKPTTFDYDFAGPPATVDAENIPF